MGDDAMTGKLLFSVTPEHCELQTFTVKGPGGSGKDTSNTGVRWIHHPSGAVGEAREERSQPANKRRAWKRMATHENMTRWLKLEAARRMGEPSIEDRVEEAMQPHHLRIEVAAGGKWVKEST